MNQAPGQKDLGLPPGKIVADGEPAAGRQVLNLDDAFLAELPVDARESQNVTLIDTPVLVRILEGERKHAVVDQILPMDSGEALRDYDPESQVARRKRRVLTARPLAVIAAGDDAHGLPAHLSPAPDRFGRFPRKRSR